VLKRLGSKKVLQPHAGATLRFWPTGSHSNRQQQQRTDSSAPDHQQQSQQQQEFELQTDLLMLVAGNSRQMGRTVAVCPDALLDDGLLDFTLLSGTSLATQVCVYVWSQQVPCSSTSLLNRGDTAVQGQPLPVLRTPGWMCGCVWLC
jgi:hypothetical protein